MSRAATALLAVLMALAGLLGGYFYGRSEGRKLEQANTSEQTVNALSGLIESHKNLIAQADQASRNMRSALARRAAADAKTTEEFKDALAATADSRTGCVFSDDVMRQLAAARGRAAQAATGGIQSTVPNADTGTNR